MRQGLRRILALNTAIWHNWLIDAPVKRSLVAYDHGPAPTLSPQRSSGGGRRVRRGSGRAGEGAPSARSAGSGATRRGGSPRSGGAPQDVRVVRSGRGGARGGPAPRLALTASPAAALLGGASATLLLPFPPKELSWHVSASPGTPT
ncbi:hypothetical protein DEF28_18210 [Marinitenerispora sediminis]|uniref:Uncharacterized protein n=1 Tax=Marinitenerispora sediminis TaxID=1931232 RepID=A0A368TC28_9ACTN|nr:hypothetical protein DEF28_18210 [Marinitenerispora sediminis]RCV62500.1 hypothetical protein DEF24_01050 [Marinitenerispora sediminis]